MIQFYNKVLLFETNLIIFNFIDRAPTDCRQYFTGVSGSVKSYNFAGTQMLGSQIYTNCFRQEIGKTSKISETSKMSNGSNTSNTSYVD
jgi:hypothetical protein